MTIPVQKIKKVRFTESCRQKRVVFTREKPGATSQIQDERAWKGSGRPVIGTCGSGSTSSASAEVLRQQWVRRTNIPAVETSPKKFLLSMDYVCSQVILGSNSSCKWEPVGTENGLVTDMLKLMGFLTKSSKWLRRLVATRGGTFSSCLLYTSPSPRD